MTVTALKKNARLDLKTTQHNKDLLAQAAFLRGVDMTSFIIEPALKAAREVIEQLQLQETEQEALFKALSKPTAPTEGLKDLLSAGIFSER